MPSVEKSRSFCMKQGELGVWPQTPPSGGARNLSSYLVPYPGFRWSPWQGKRYLVPPSPAKGKSVHVERLVMSLS